MDLSFPLGRGLALLPAVGLGTYKVRGVETVAACVRAAINAGYKHIDTAAVYR